jgi:hypothetical protein
MTYTIIIDAPNRLARVTADGTEHMEAALESMRSLRRDPAFRPGYGVLCDLRRQSFVPDAMQASGLGTLMGGFFYGHRLAFVIADAAHVMAQHMVIAAASSEVMARVFGDPREAESWLLD